MIPLVTVENSVLSWSLEKLKPTSGVNVQFFAENPTLAEWLISKVLILKF